MAPGWVCNQPANPIPLQWAAGNPALWILLWDDPKGLDTADLKRVQGSLLSTKGAMVFTPWEYKHWLQAHTSVGSWTLNTWAGHSWEKASGQVGTQLRLPQRTSSHRGPGWAVRDHGCRHTPAHGRGSPGALVKMKEMQDKEKLSQSRSQKFKLPHQAHPVSAERDSVINKER